MQIAAAGNTEVPSYLVLIAKGYEVSYRCGEDDDLWFAKRDQNVFSASGPLELLGLVAMAESRGVNWRATDREIDMFLTKYPPT